MDVDTPPSSDGSKSNPPELLKTIDTAVVAQLTSMGFGLVRAQKAVILTKAKNIEQAMDWSVSSHISVPNQSDIHQLLFQ
jgi:uncharacterized UBP type Zn finger protein